MSTEEHKPIHRRFIEEVMNPHNVGRLEEILRSNLIEHAPSVPSGTAGARQVTAAYFTAFPDLHLAMDELIAEGDEVVAHLTATGTHQGVFHGIPLTGKQVPISSLDAWRVQDGKDAELWSQVDSFGILHQLGVMPAPGQAGSVVSATLVSTETGGECHNTRDFRSAHAWEPGLPGCWRARPYMRH
jgi:predicted ester cyclase